MRVYVDSDYLNFVITSVCQPTFYWVGIEYFNSKAEAVEHCQANEIDVDTIVKQETMLPPWSVEKKVDIILNGKKKFFKQKFGEDCSLVWFIGGDGSTNFRYQIDPMYKHKRPEKPFYSEYVKHLTVQKLKPIQINGLETDDVVAIFADLDKDSVLVSNDKDLRNVTTKLYNPTKMTLVDNTADMALRHFIGQTIKGDPCDGITSIKGCGPKFVDKFFETYTTLPNTYTELVHMMGKLCDDNNKNFDEEKFRKDFWLLDMGGQVSGRLGLEHPYQHLFDDVRQRARKYLKRRFNIEV